MEINQKIFKAYDIRGVYPSDIDEEKMVLIIKVIYKVFTEQTGRENLSVVLGRDMRLSSPSLHDIAKKTLVDLGAQVIDIGLSTTPTVYFATLYYKYDAGIQISASHNPKEYNGLKIVRRDGNKIIKIGKNTGMARIKELVVSKKFTETKPAGKILTKTNIVKDEVDFAFNLVQPRAIKKLKIVADTANSMGSLYLEEIFKRTPCELIKMNFDLDGTFPVHQADPLQSKTLIDLQKRVIIEKADFGIATDGDADRIFYIDEKGRVIQPTLITSLITRELLSKFSGEKIIIDIRYQRNATKVAHDLGGSTSISPVGHALITEQLNRENGIFAGESSGHYFFRDNGGAESPIRVIIHILDLLSKTNKLISELVSELTTSYESGETNYILPETVDVKELLNEFASEYHDGQISWLDGIAIDYPDWRFNIRTSNTEPLLRLNIEGLNKELVMGKLGKIKDKILSTGAKVKE